MKKNRLEYLNYGLDFLVVSISVVLFLLFCFEYDLQQTASSSYAILSGHILDFYDYNIKTSLNRLFLSKTSYSSLLLS